MRDDRPTAPARRARLTAFVRSSAVLRSSARGLVALLVAVAVLWIAFHLR